MHVAKVLQAELDKVTQPQPGALGPLRSCSWGSRSVTPTTRRAVLARRVQGHRPPAAADVEQARAGAQVELTRDEVDLSRLRLLEGFLGRGEDGARVRHRRTEHHLVEAVRHVVVVRHAWRSRLLECMRPRGRASTEGGASGRSAEGPATASSSRSLLNFSRGSALAATARRGDRGRRRRRCRPLRRPSPDRARRGG